MDKNLPNDPLEEFFKKSLEGMNDLPSDDGWDVPSVDVWDRVEENIQRPVAIVRPINYWKWTAIAASFAVMVLAYQFFNQGQQINELTVEVNENNQELDVVKELLENKSKELNSVIAKEKDSPISNQQSPDPSLFTNEQEEVVQSDVDQSKVERTTSFSGNRAGSLGGKNNDGSPSISTTSNQKLKPITNQNNSIVFTPEQNQNNEIPSINQGTISDNSNNIKKEERTVLVLETLPTRIFETSTSKNILNDFILESTPVATIDILHKSSNSKFYIGGYMSKNRGMKCLSTEDSNMGEDRKRMIKSNRDKEYWTLGGGVKLGYQLNNRWSIETGLQYAKAKIESKHRIEKKYTSDSEMTNPLTGELENEYVFSIVTATGDIGSDVTLSRPPSFMIPEGAPFDLELTSLQNIEFLSIPIMAKYKVGNEKINMGFKAGMLTSFTLDSDVEIRNVDHPSPMFHHRKHRIKDKSELKQLKSATVDLIAGVEAEVKIAKSTYLSLEPSFSRSLTPIFEKSDVKTFPMMASVKVGVNYLF